MGSGLRVTGGSFGGRRLKVPSRNARPTSDRVRESLFARLTDLEGARVLDVFAGSGALGIEALSRGADSAIFLEQAAHCTEVLRDNLRSLGLESRTTVVRGDALRGIVRLGREGRSFDLVLLDPPYQGDHAELALQVLVEARVVAEGAMVVVERSRRHALPLAAGLELLDERRYGETLISRYQPVDRGDEASGQQET